ncbi:MAG: cytochrome bc complex cytochrome b subunit [Actinobacteria bacterium]|nr:cytochrome bc complex cytochrome b subunit [Actinomycetota bacterium]
MKPVSRPLRRIRADHWSFLFAEMAAYSFVVAVLSGVFLAVFFRPSMTGVVYHGSYQPLDGVQVSEAYRSTLHISFDVRGGLLMRQIHHWSTLIFVAAVCLQLLRLFVTGAFRRPRRLNWLIWVSLLLLGMAVGWTGGILPNDMQSGGSLGVLQSVLESIPLIGTRLTLLVFGGQPPGGRIIGRVYWVHVLLPVAMAGLLLGRRWLVRRHGHTRFPAPAATGRLRSARGSAVPAMAMFFATCAVLALLGALAQINPVWLAGPYQPGAISAGTVPDWYMGFLDGALRIMPGWELRLAGHPLTLAVLVPGLIIPGAFFTALAAWPLLEARLTGDRRIHHILDRPRDAAARTAAGAAGITFYGLLWAAAANDQLAYHLGVDLYSVTWFFRVAVVAGPLLAFTLTQRICLGLTRRERDETRHGRPTGRIVMSPDGGFGEITEPGRRVPERMLEKPS